MNAQLDGAVELLERSLAYTRVALASVPVDRRHRRVPTPCARWDLESLLTHLEDALDAFTEAAAGTIVVEASAAAGGRKDALQTKACSLLGAWTSAASEDRTHAMDIAVGERRLPGHLLVSTAALEIAIHGWDVGQATGACPRIPASLARGLLDTAAVVVLPTDRGIRFAQRKSCAADDAPDVRLLAFLGRPMTGPGWQNRAKVHARPSVAS